jgi:hypothetical protein
MRLKDNTFDYIVSGGDEKILRILEPIHYFANFHNSLSTCQLKLPNFSDDCLICQDPILYHTVGESNQEVMGLMTKIYNEQRTNFYFDENQKQE